MLSEIALRLRLVPFKSLHRRYSHTTSL
jgi:hypothetical protein